MNTLTTQELEQRGLAAVDEALQAGPVHIVDEDRPRFVVLSEERYRDLLEAEDEAYVARVQASLADAEAGRVRRFDSVNEMMQALEEDDEA
jgi:PHD/YefM family antitoxin component YafN of YafNO toxin-antitoxin module